jgi:hypothetical protein
MRKMTQNKTLRIKFTLNRETGSTSKGQTRLKRVTEVYAGTVVQEVGLLYAAGEFKYLKSQIAGHLDLVVQKELLHLTELYKQFIIGKTRVGRGTLTTVAGGVTGRPFPLSGALPLPWAERSPKYLAQKQKHIGHQRWFEYTGYLERAMTPQNWEAWFGPLHVTVQPIQSRKAKEGSLTEAPAAFVRTGGKMKFGVARIGVSLFGLLTPSMLGALATGDMSAGKAGGDGRTNGLLALVAAHDPEAARHLAPNNQFRKTPYRPTIEPFLAFAVTRSLPAAVFKRLQDEGLSQAVQ